MMLTLVATDAFTVNCIVSPYHNDLFWAIAPVVAKGYVCVEIVAYAADCSALAISGNN